MVSAITELKIDIKGSPEPGVTSMPRIALHVGDVALTRLIRPHEHAPDDYVQAPPMQLAFWLVDNWWRIRWECMPSRGMTADWRLAHELSAIGGGYIWPRLALWGEGSRVGLLSRSDPPGVVGPVRYLTDSLLFIPAVGFEAAVDEFISNTIDMYFDTDADRAALRAQVHALQAERADPEVAAWRRMEARLGFDPDEAPEAAIESMAGYVDRFGASGVEEAAAATPGVDAAKTLEREIEAAIASRIECQFATTLDRLRVPGYEFSIQRSDNAGSISSTGSSDGVLEPSWRFGRSIVPWELAEDAATCLRDALGLKRGPLRNKALAEVLGTVIENLRGTSSSHGGTLPYGLRLKSEDGHRHRIAVRSRWPHDRRFELARALGDAIWADGERLGPLATSKTARQKFQRAFAQSLLCPHDDLVAYMGTKSPGDADISAAAQHFHVSERVVRTVLVNKGMIERDRLVRLDQLDIQQERLEEIIDAA